MICLSNDHLAEICVLFKQWHASAWYYGSLIHPAKGFLIDITDHSETSEKHTYESQKLHELSSQGFR